MAARCAVQAIPPTRVRLTGCCEWSRLGGSDGGPGASGRWSWSWSSPLQLPRGFVPEERTGISWLLPTAWHRWIGVLCLEPWWTQRHCLENLNFPLNAYGHCGTVVIVTQDCGRSCTLSTVDCGIGRPLIDAVWNVALCLSENQRFCLFPISHLPDFRASSWSSQCLPQDTSS